MDRSSNLLEIDKSEGDDDDSESDDSLEEGEINLDEFEKGSVEDIFDDFSLSLKEVAVDSSENDSKTVKTVETKKTKYYKNEVKKPKSEQIDPNTSHTENIIKVTEHNFDSYLKEQNAEPTVISEDLEEHAEHLVDENITMENSITMETNSLKLDQYERSYEVVKYQNTKTFQQTNIEFASVNYVKTSKMRTVGYECKKCNNKVKESELKDHMKIHIKQKLDCNNCGIIFKDKSDYHKHMRSHNIYECPECGRHCQKKSHLDEHLLVHRGVNLYKCPKCDWGFRRKDKRNRHMTVCEKELKQENMDMKQFDKENIAKIEEAEAAGTLPVKKVTFKAFTSKQQEWEPINEFKLVQEPIDKPINDVIDEHKVNKRRKWRNGKKPDYWVDGKYVCHICDYDLGYY